MSQFDRRQILQMIAVTSAVPFIPPVFAAADGIGGGRGHRQMADHRIICDAKGTRLGGIRTARITPASGFFSCLQNASRRRASQPANVDWLAISL